MAQLPATRRVTAPPRGGPVSQNPLAPSIGPLSPVSSAQSVAGAVQIPQYRPPTAPPPPSAAPIPPTPPPTVVAPRLPEPDAPSTNPRVQLLLQEMQTGETRDQDRALQNQQLSDLLSQLMRGEGIKIGDVSNDPAARAYAVARQRSVARAREEEAAMAAANPGMQGGAFEGRAAQLREAAGEDIARNLADVATKRRGEALSTAITGANLQISELARQAQDRQADKTDKLRLLDVLLADDGRKRSTYEAERDRQFRAQDRDTVYGRDQAERRYQEQREAERQALRDQLLRDDVTESKRRMDEANRNRSRRAGGGTGFRVGGR